MRTAILGRATTLVAAIIVLLAAGRAAEAKDTNGKLGLGAARTLGGVSGLDVVRWFGSVGLNATLGAEYISPERGESGYQLGLAIGGLYPFVRGDVAELSIGGRLDLGLLDRGVGDSATQVSIEVPLRVEWWITDALALNLEVGAVVEIVPAEGRVLTSASGENSAGEGTGISLGGTNLVGGAGFHFYF